MDTHTFSSTSGKKKRKRGWTAVMRESTDRESWPLIIRRGFTEDQRKELHEQAVIHRHISAGLPVPVHLVLPLLKAVVSSLGPISFCNQFPSLLREGCESRREMAEEEEPGRCRRTDGKKWRCRRDVISGQKYCEAHVHRGRRQRSRKLVEESPCPKPHPPPRQHRQIPNPDPASVSVGLQLMTGSAAVDGFSPKSVLEEEEEEGERRRCRRTDGKKWRCRREVVAQQKYCQGHMHRGAKKRGPPDTSLCISIRSQTTSSDTTLTDASA